MLTNKPATQILVDGGGPGETLRIKTLIGFVDGQTTNPSLIAQNPEIQQLIASGHRLSSEEEEGEYKKIVQSISPLVGDAGVSIPGSDWREIEVNTIEQACDQARNNHERPRSSGLPGKCDNVIGFRA